MQATFLSDDELPDWQFADSLIAGVDPSNVSIVANVGISTESGRRVRVDIQANAGYSCFRDIRCVESVVYIGYGQCLFVIHPHDGRVEVHLLDGYFGHLYNAEELDVAPHSFSVLVVSASELLSFSSGGVLQWRTSELGIDGVVVESVKADVVKGSGEWDPPGGWKAFNVSARTGEKNVA